MNRTIDYSDVELEFDAMVEDGRTYLAADDLIAFVRTVLERVPRRTAAGRSIHNFLGGLADNIAELDQKAKIADLHDWSGRL